MVRIILQDNWEQTILSYFYYDERNKQNWQTDNSLVTRLDETGLLELYNSRTLILVRGTRWELWSLKFVSKNCWAGELLLTSQSVKVM